MNSLQQFPSQQNHTPLKRTRAKRSCDFCRKRKSRCDADSSTPCSNCKAWGYTCEFETVRKKRGPPSVYVDNLEKKCKKMESLLTTLTQCSIEDLERNDFQYNNKKKIINSDTSSDDEEEIQDISNHYDSIKYTGSSSTGFNLIDQFQSITSIPWPGRENTILKLMSQQELMIERTDSKSDTYLDVGLSMKSSHNIKPFIISNKINLKKPARHQLDKIIGIYFSHLHLVLPIINKNKFLTQYHHATHDSILTQAVLALTFRFASKYLADQKDMSVYCEGYATKVFQQLKHFDRSKLSYVQAALLMVLYLDMKEEEDVDSLQWHTLGQAIRMAQELGLHRSCRTWNLPRSEIETRHRVFYACYVMDRWHGARTGKPLTILDRDFDTELPSPYEIMNEEVALGLPIYRKFLLLIQLSEILGRVLKALYAPKSKISNLNANLDDATIVSVLDVRLNQWKASLHEPLDGVFLSELDKLNLKIYGSTVVLLLHRPLSSQHPESEKICTETALECIDIVTQRQEQTVHPSYYTIFCAPSCFVYALLQPCLVFLSNALKTKSVSDIQMLHQSMAIMKKYKDISSTTLDILHMLISIHHLDTEKVQKMIKPTKKIQPFLTEVPKSYYFQQRHDDLKMAVPNQPNYYTKRPVFVQNYPTLSNTFSHQRSISLDQVNPNQQHMYTHTRSISHDDLGMIVNRPRHEMYSSTDIFTQPNYPYDLNIPSSHWSDWDVYIQQNTQETTSPIQYT